MPKTYVSFGQQHVHKVCGHILDRDCIARIEAKTVGEGRAKVFKYFGPKFCFEYHEDEFNMDNMKYFPRGFIDLA